MIPRRLSWILKAAVPALLLTLLLRNADLADISGRIGRIPLRIFSLALVLSSVSLALQALRWKLLVGEREIPYRECYAFLGLGSALAMVSPTIALADGAVGYWLGRRRRMALRTVSSLFLARLLGVAGGLCLLLAALPSHRWVPVRLLLEWSLRQSLIAALLLAAALSALYLANRRRKRLSELRDSALPALRRPGLVAAAAGLSVVIQLLQMGVLWLGYLAIGAPVGYLDVVFFTPLIAFLGIAPVSIGGMGVREGLGIFFYTLLPGVGREHVLAQAGYGYLVLLAMAGINLAVAAVVLGLPRVTSASARPRPRGARTGSGSPGPETP